MFFITRDIRMAGVGLPVEFGGYFIEGVDNDTTDGAADVTPDRLKLMGDIEEPLVLTIQNYQGSAANLSVEDFSFEQYPYPDDYYANKLVLILPNPSSDCRVGEFREITHITHNQDGTNEKVNFSPGLSKDYNPPGGLSGTCLDSDNYDGGFIGWIDLKEYWLDVTGNYPGLAAGENGYIGGGQGSVLYCTHNGVHYPIAQNVENLQFQYNGDINDDGTLDGFLDWNSNWTMEEIGRIRQIRVWVLGKTSKQVVSVSGYGPENPPYCLTLYRRPAIANTMASGEDDMHKRFLLESTANIRNLSLNIYNNGVR